MGSIARFSRSHRSADARLVHDSGHGGVVETDGGSEGGGVVEGGGHDGWGPGSGNTGVGVGLNVGPGGGGSPAGGGGDGIISLSDGSSNADTDGVVLVVEGGGLLVDGLDGVSIGVVGIDLDLVSRVVIGSEGLSVDVEGGGHVKDGGSSSHVVVGVDVVGHGAGGGNGHDALGTGSDGLVKVGNWHC